MRRALARRGGVWVPAFAGTTLRDGWMTWCVTCRRYLLALLAGAPALFFHGLCGRARDAAETAEEFTENIAIIAAVYVLAMDWPQQCILRRHQCPPKSSLKRASSRTKSSKRRLAAASSRSANQASALADIAHSSKARCARSPRSVKIRMRSVITPAPDGALKIHSAPARNHGHLAIERFIWSGTVPARLAPHSCGLTCQRVAVITSARIRPSTAPLPKRLAKASAAFAVASSIFD